MSALPFILGIIFIILVLSILGISAGISCAPIQDPNILVSPEGERFLFPFTKLYNSVVRHFVMSRVSVIMNEIEDTVKTSVVTVNETIDVFESSLGTVESAARLASTVAKDAVTDANKVLGYVRTAESTISKSIGDIESTVEKGIEKIVNAIE